MIRKESSPEEALCEDAVLEADLPREAPLPPDGDAAVLERFVTRGDPSAFEELVSRHERLVMGVCARILGNLQAAEDAFQETFLALARRAAAIRDPASLSGWLHRVASNEAIRLRLQARRRAAREAGVERPIVAPPEPALEDRQVLEFVDEALADLPDKYRLPLILHYLEGQTTEAAAHRLGHPKGSMSTLLARGLELLRAGLQERGVAVTGALLAASLAAQAQAAVVRSAVLAAPASGAAVAGVLKSIAAALIVGAGILGPSLLADLPVEASPPPRPFSAVAAPPPAPRAPSIPDPAELRPERPLVPPPEAPAKTDVAQDAPAELPDLPGTASDRAEEAHREALQRRASDANGPPAHAQAGKGKDKPTSPGLERAREAGRGAQKAAEQAHKAAQQTRGKSGK